jgi:hypothetical protein
MKYILSLTFLGCIIGTVILIISCSSNETYYVSYAHDTEPIFKTYCSPCHISEDASTGNLNLSSYTSLMAGTSNNGPVVVPGDADHSLLYEAVSKPSEEQSVLSGRMPYGLNPLNSTQINQIEDWINEGAKDN